MEEARLYYKRRKPRVILDRRFLIFKELNVGDKGQALFNGEIEAEEIENNEDASDLLIKTRKLDRIEKVNEIQMRAR